MKKQKLAHLMLLGLVFLLISLGAKAQQRSTNVLVTQVAGQQGWFDVQFSDAESAYSLKALMADKAGKDAIIHRLYVDDVRHVARIELIDKHLQGAQVKSIIEQKALGRQSSSEK